MENFIDCIIECFRDESVDHWIEKMMIEGGFQEETTYKEADGLPEEFKNRIEEMNVRNVESHCFKILCLCLRFFY